MYTDNETQSGEHVERVEATTAGWETQRLSPAQSPTPATTVLPGNTALTPANAPLGTLHDRRTNILGLALIVIGLLAMFGRVLPGAGAITAGMILLTIASAFLFFAFWRRIYGLLIPGSILAGLSLGVPFAGLTSGVSIVWGLALGFGAILLIGKTYFNMHHPWPAIPAVILFGVGVIIAVANLPTIFGASLMWLPLLLIAAGLFLGWGRRTT